MRGVVVERNEVLDPASRGELERVVQRAVAPPDPLLVLVVGVLRVVDQYVDAGRELEPRAPVGRLGELAAASIGSWSGR